MRIRNQSRFLFASEVTSRAARTLELCAVVRGSFRLDDPIIKRLFVEKGSPLPQGMISGDRYLPGDDEGQGELVYASDFAGFKPRGEVLLRGNAFAPGGAKVPEVGVRVAVGAWSKVLRVVGNRRWTGRGTPSEPEPFEAMPIDWFHAWGGPRHPVNPVGRDLEAAEVPNLEAPDEPIVDRKHMHRAMAFAPINRRWPTRMKKMGKVDADYDRLRAPWYPEGFDWTFFQAAPDDQQIEGYFRGDEAVHLQNLHPTKPVLVTRLPGVRIRVFGKRWDKGAHAGATFEVPMALDTVSFEMADDKVVLTWRGLAPVERVDRQDVPFVLVAEEPLAQAPKPRAEYEAELEAFAADPNDMKGWMSTEMAALQASAGGALPGPKTKDGAAAVDALLGKRFGPLAEPHRGKVRDFLRRAMGDAAKPPAGAGGSGSAAARAGAGGGAAINAALLAAAAAGAQAPKSTGATAGVGGGGGSMPSVRLRESVADIEAAAREAQRSLADQGRRPRGVSQLANLSKNEQLRALDPSLAAAGARKKDPVPRAGGSCKGGNYAGQSFDGQDLSGVDFSHCLLEKTSFRGATLRGAKLDGAIGVEADFTGAVLDGAHLKNGNFSRAKLEGASLAGTRIERTTMEEADFTNARASGIRLEEVILRAAKLDEAVLVEATVVRSILNEASMARADISRAKIEGTLFNDAVAPGLVAIETVFVDSCWNGASLDGADFSRSSFASCSFFKAKLASARFGGANGPDAMFLEADLTAAVLRGGLFRDARFADAILRKADFTGADLMQADFSRAIMDDAIFVNASAYGAQFWNASGQRTRFDGADLTRSQPVRA
jgi:uncharacterized protein YjbI with pentapeptide repeats